MLVLVYWLEWYRLIMKKKIQNNKFIGCINIWYIQLSTQHIISILIMLCYYVLIRALNIMLVLHLSA